MSLKKSAAFGRLIFVNPQPLLRWVVPPAVQPFVVKGFSDPRARTSPVYARGMERFGEHPRPMRSFLCANPLGKSIRSGFAQEEVYHISLVVQAFFYKFFFLSI